MDSVPDVVEHESSAKRIKLDQCPFNIGELCNGDNFAGKLPSKNGPIDTIEGVSADCDSGYEASTLESIPTSSHHTSPSQTDPIGDCQENLSEIFLTPSHNEETDLSAMDTSQDSIEDDDDNVSTVSELSGLSELSGQDWKPMAGSMIWIQKQMQNGVNPRGLLSDLGVDLEQVPQYVDEVTLWKLIINMLAEPPRRNKLRHVNTLDDVVRLVKGAQNIIVLTGAGVSVSCGIPDFRSRDGIYSRLAIDFPNLPDPQAMFDISYFSQDPRPFFKFARDIYPGKFTPSPCHRFIKMLEKHGKLLRNYTQNIDTLEKVANIEKVIECHGSFATATCTKCNYKVTADKIRETVLEQKIPLCDLCHKNNDDNNDDNKNSISTDDDLLNNDENYFKDLVSSGIMKPDIVFFGEGLPDTFHEAMSEDKSKCDLLLVIGSSLKVRPVALIPSSLPSNVPQILINREPLPHCHFDVELLGDCDVIINHLCHLFGGTWREGIYNEKMLEEVTHLLPLDSEDVCCNETKPNCSNSIVEICKCDEMSTKCSSSLVVEKNVNKQMSITQQSPIMDSEYVNLSSPSSKERHMSIDSARDSGIGDNSNFTDLETKYDYTSDQENLIENNQKSYFDNKTVSNDDVTATTTTDMRGYWQPKIKKSLADRLPENSFYLIQPNRYIFPGAELYYDPDEKFDIEDVNSLTNSESESDCEHLKI